MRVKRALPFLAALLLTVGWGSVWAQAGTAPYRNVTAAALHQMLAAKDFFFVNVHIPYEGEIAATDAFIPFDKTKALLGRYPADKSARIVLYCRSGRMSDVAARELAAAGYTNLYNLAGGMIAWEEAGLPLKVDPSRE